MDASSPSSRAWSSLSSSTSSCPLHARSFHRLRYGVPQCKLVKGELRRPAKLVENACGRLSVRCRVIRDIRDESLVSNFLGEKQSLLDTRYWPEEETSDITEAGTLLPCDDYKVEGISEHVNGRGDRVETYREDLSLACLDDEDDLSEESTISYSDHPLHSRVEILEGIPVWQWLSTFVESINPRLRGIIILNTITFLFGSNIAVVKETEFSLDPASFSVGRFAIAAIVFSPFLKGVTKQPGVLKAGLELGVWSGIAYLAQAVGLMTTDAGRASFFTTFSVLTVPLFAGLMGKKIPLLTWFAAVAALFGVGLLETSGAPPSVGDAWSLLSAVVFGIHMIRTEFHSRNLDSSAAFPIIALQMSVITASSMIWSFASHVTSGETLPSLATLDWPELYQTALGMPWGSMFYTGLFSTALCLSAELIAMRDVSATEAAVINALEPLWGAAVAWIALGERWGLRGWVGAAFILSGSLVTQIWGSPETLENPVHRPKELGTETFGKPGID